MHKQPNCKIIVHVYRKCDNCDSMKNEANKERGSTDGREKDRNIKTGQQ